MCTVFSFGIFNVFCSAEDAFLYMLAAFVLSVFLMTVMWGIIFFKSELFLVFLGGIFKRGHKAVFSLISFYFLLFFLEYLLWSGALGYEFYADFWGLKFLVMSCIISFYVAILFVVTSRI